jgi:hypothetical protein
MATVSAPDITKKLFGGIFDVDGSGHYPGLELINLVVCCAEGTLPTTERVHVHRAAHDFARQLITEQLDEKRKDAVLLNEHTAMAVAHLLRCLELEVPNVVKAKGWERTHFFPYTRSLVHWDARKGRQAGVDVQIERRYLRGAGAYAFAVLRRDADQQRLEETRAGFEALYPGIGVLRWSFLHQPFAPRGSAIRTTTRHWIRSKRHHRSAMTRGKNCSGTARETSSATSACRRCSGSGP